MRGCIWVQWFFFFFGRFFQHICPFHNGWFKRVPAHTALSVQEFWTKNAWPPCPTLPIYLISPRATFFGSPWWKRDPTVEHFASVEGVKWKVSEALKGIIINEFKNLFSAVEKISPLVYFTKWRVHQRWLNFKHVRINTQFFINKFNFWVPPHIANIKTILLVFCISLSLVENSAHIF